MSALNLLTLVVIGAFVFVIKTPERCGGLQSGIGNWTYEDLEQYRKNRSLTTMASKNCSIFYEIVETTKFLNECTTLITGSNHLVKQRVRREFQLEPNFYRGDPNSDLDASISGGHFDSDSDIKLIEKTERVRRSPLGFGEKEFLPTGIRIRVNNPWRIMESKAIVDNPCIGQCMLQRMSILDDFGVAQRNVIISKIFEVLDVANGTREDAADIAELCIHRFIRRLQKLELSSENSSVKETEKCRAGSRLGICLSREAYNSCRDAFIGSVTSTKIRPKPKQPMNPSGSN